MFAEVTYMEVFGFPLIVYGGALTLLCFLATGFVAYGTRKGIIRVPVKWHYRLAFASISLGLVHATFGILARL